MKVSELWVLEGPPKQSRSFCRVWSRSIVKFKLKDFRCVLYGCPTRPTLVTSTVRALIRWWKQSCLYHASSFTKDLTTIYLWRSLNCERWKVPPNKGAHFAESGFWFIVKFKLKDFKCVLYGCPMRPTLVTSTVRALIRWWKQPCLYHASSFT